MKKILLLTVALLLLWPSGAGAAEVLRLRVPAWGTAAKIRRVMGDVDILSWRVGNRSLIVADQINHCTAIAYGSGLSLRVSDCGNALRVRASSNSSITKRVTIRYRTRR